MDLKDDMKQIKEQYLLNNNKNILSLKKNSKLFEK